MMYFLVKTHVTLLVMFVRALLAAPGLIACDKKIPVGALLAAPLNVLHTPLKGRGKQRPYACATLTSPLINFGNKLSRSFSSA